MMRPVYIAGDNIITSLGFTTPEVIHKVEYGITGFQKYDDHSLTPTPLPLSLVNTDLLTGKFREILVMRHPEMREEHFTRLEKMFIVSIHDAVKETEPPFTGPTPSLLFPVPKEISTCLKKERKTSRIPAVSTFGRWLM